MKKVIVSVSVVLILAAVAVAQPAINVGTHYVAPDTAGQTIEVYVTGADPVQGLEFNVQIGQGVSGPTFEQVDIFTGTIFSANNEGLFPGSYIDPRAAYQGTTTVFGTTVDTDGLLATLTIDTTGLFDGQYSLSLIDTPEGRTNFAGVYVDITDGLIIVPEPTSLAIFLLGAAAVVRRRRRRRASMP